MTEQNKNIFFTSMKKCTRFRDGIPRGLYHQSGSTTKISTTWWINAFNVDLFFVVVWSKHKQEGNECSLNYYETFALI